MDPAKKKDIIDDLDMFKKGKEYHNRVGKPWKRGYLLYGPPGTGKSTMVAAMANYLEYDVYDFELTSVKTNTDLRKLLIETKSKSIMVFEDIDCSLDLTGKRKSKEEEDKDDGGGDGEEDPTRRPDKKGGAKSNVTLSGLLNFIDGLWSACGEERLIVFTTNHADKLDAALVRTGRMDKKIEMSYCDFESFKFLARMHLHDGVVEEHEEQCDRVKALLEEVDMAPVDVGEHLTPKSPGEFEDAGPCLARLVTALEEKAKEDARSSAPQVV
jgi:chaperone BCS1